VAKVSVKIKAPPHKVWEALTTPAIIKEYLFGTQAVSDFKVGSPITYKGQWQGKEYEDKGMILEVVREKRLASTYWSSMGGKEDKPENYNKVTYELTEHEGGTTVTLTQDNNPDEKSREHSEKNWTMVLNKMKEVLER